VFKEWEFAPYFDKRATLVVSSLAPLRLKLTGKYEDVPTCAYCVVSASGLILKVGSQSSTGTARTPRSFRSRLNEYCAGGSGSSVRDAIEIVGGPGVDVYVFDADRAAQTGLLPAAYDTGPMGWEDWLHVSCRYQFRDYPLAESKGGH
jgi:hypothetical protein